MSSTYISVTWNKPSEPTGDIIQYSVYVTNPAGTCVQHVQLCSGICAQPTESCAVNRSGTFPDNQEHFMETISGLLAYTQYTFTLYAYTAVGRGDGSSTASTTNQSEPNQIKDVIKESITATTITISFNEPKPCTGPIVLYEVRYIYLERICNGGRSTGDVTTQYTNCTPSSGRTVCPIDNLYPYWNYSISVRAYTSVGPGNWSDTLLQQTDQDKPSVINTTSLRPTLITANNVTLEWSAPCPPNGVISHYVILWTTSSHIHTSDDSVSYTVAGLLPYRNYTYQVAAVTGAGIGNYTPVKNPYNVNRWYKLRSLFL
ncbi:cell adhesion molecule DSCAML1-like [Argopecten irradians]|uniref:cell adhesion molecule DSCAML1-like n=1 Tax=Argopecten irradians TaxID=31199 RepID=UPI00371EA1C3